MPPSHWHHPRVGWMYMHLLSYTTQNATDHGVCTPQHSPRSHVNTNHMPRSHRAHTFWHQACSNFSTRRQLPWRGWWTAVWPSSTLHWACARGCGSRCFWLLMIYGVLAAIGKFLWTWCVGCSRLKSSANTSNHAGFTRTIATSTKTLFCTKTCTNYTTRYEVRD